MGMDVKEAIRIAEEHLDDDPSFSAYVLRDLDENKKWKGELSLLAKGEYGAHKNDLLPIIKELKGGL